MAGPHTLTLHVFGTGVVGAALLDQLRDQASFLASRGLTLQVATLANSRGGLRGQSLDLTDWRAQLAAEAKPLVLSTWLQEAEPGSVLVDCSTSPELAQLVQPALARGLHVVAANKKANSGPLSEWVAIRETAARQGVRFLYETNAGAGLPLLDTLANLTLTGDRVERIEGILSGSLSFILGLLGEGVPLSVAVRTAKAKGFTEPDPRDDLSGMDVMRKLIILARDSGFLIEPEAVEVEGLLPPDFDASGSVEAFLARLEALDEAFGARISHLKALGQMLRYVGTVSPEGCRVGLRDVTPDHPLASVSGGENAVSVQTHRYHARPLVIRGYGAGAEVTAAGVFGDILRLAPPCMGLPLHFSR